MASAMQNLSLFYSDVGKLKEALAIKDRLVFLDVIIDQTENVFPMIAAGCGQHEMVLSPLSPPSLRKETIEEDE